MILPAKLYDMFIKISQDETLDEKDIDIFKNAYFQDENYIEATYVLKVYLIT